MATALTFVAVAMPAPADAQPRRAGTLIEAQTMPGAPGDALAWRVRYWTTSDRGAPIEATGVVVAPRSAVAAGPTLAWTHGAWGVAQRCAPSLSPNFFAATPGLAEAVARGYTVVAPDYPGLGAPGQHAFLVGSITAHSVLDAIRAARAIDGVRSGPRFALWGESQGGHAALWTGQLARGYAPELQLVGVAAAAPPTDLVANLRAGSDPSVHAIMTAFTAYSWSQHFGASLRTLGRPATQRVITRIARNNCVELGKKPKLGTVLSVLVLRRDLKDVDLGRIEPWARLARANSVAARGYGVPFLIAQNPKDVLVAASVTHDFARRLCRGGGRVRYVTITGKGHETSARDTAATTLDWIDARFRGGPAPSDCGRI